jgi:uncharacterized protein
MYINVKKVLYLIVLLAVGAFVGISCYKTIENNKAPKQTVTVTGNGEVEAVTDQANITVQVKTVSSSYEKAQTENKKGVDILKADLIKLGIPNSRITISSYSQPVTSEIQPVELKIQAYRPVNSSPSVTTDLNLTIDPIKNIDKIFSLVSKNTDAQIVSTYYSLKDQKKWESEAKEKALKDIRSQIEMVAKINRLKVGKLITLEDGNNPRPYPMALKAMDSSASPTNETGQTAFSAGGGSNSYSEQTVKITSTYTATYELY